MAIALSDLSLRGCLNAADSRSCFLTGVVPNSDPCQIITLLVLVGLGLGVGEGLGLGVGLRLGNHIAISTRGVIIWQGVENGHNTGSLLFVLIDTLA